MHRDTASENENVGSEATVSTIASHRIFKYRGFEYSSPYEGRLAARFRSDCQQTDSVWRILQILSVLSVQNGAKSEKVTWGHNRILIG